MRNFLFFVLFTFSGVAQAETPYHLRPMDSWQSGECYRSPHAGSGTPTTGRYGIFVVGDLVTVNDVPGEMFKVVGEEQVHYFKTSNRHAWGIPCKNIKDGRVWWLAAGRMKRMDKPILQNR